jgi:toxin-antitoxin system PIN domain toxin
MNCFDVNILIYAHRRDQPAHAFYREYLEAEIGSGRPFALSILAAGAFVRIVTRERFQNKPTPLSQALAEIENFASRANCHWIGPGQRHWALLSNLCRNAACSGKLVADAQHASIAIEHACQWVTRDRDFERFRQDGLRLKIIEP